MTRDGDCKDGATVADIGAAIDRRVGVDGLAPQAGARYPDAIPMAWHRGKIADCQNRRCADAAPPQKGKDRIVAIVGNQPVKTGGIGIALMKRGLVAIKSIEVADQALDAAVMRVIAGGPIDLAIVVPFVPLRELAAHEDKLFAGMRPHEAEIGA